MIPLIVAIHDFWTVRTHEPSYGQDGGTSRLASLQSRIARSRYRFLLPTICLALGIATITAATESPRSTYICADVFRYRGVVPFSQVLATILDCSIIILVVGLVNRGKVSQAPDAKSYSSVGWAFIVSCMGIEVLRAGLNCSQFSSIILAVSGALFVIFRPEYRSWAFAFSFYYIRSLCAFASAALLSILCALYAVSSVCCIRGPLLTCSSWIAWEH